MINLPSKRHLNNKTVPSVDNAIEPGQILGKGIYNLSL